MKRIGIWVLVTLPVVMSACGPTNAAVSQATKPPAPNASSVSSPWPCPGPTLGTASPSEGTLACQLAVAEFSSVPGRAPVAHGGGFLTPPSATYSADPGAQIVPLADPNRGGLWQTVAQPVLIGDGGPMTARCDAGFRCPRPSCHQTAPIMPMRISCYRPG